MTKVDTSFNNFARGRIDHDMMGRYDLPIYYSGNDLVENFITNFKGNAIYRAGFEKLFLFEDCFFVEFKFNKEQQYLCVFFNTKIRFLTYASDGTFGFVESSPSVILEITTPYTLAESKTITATQNDDVMIVTVKGIEPHKLIRTSATNFTFNVFARKLDPFVLTNDSTTTITNVTQATEAVVSVTGHPYVAGDRVTFADIVGMTELNTFTARVVADLTANTFSIDVDTTEFSSYSSAGTAALVLTGDFPKLCLFYKARLYYGATPLKITTIFGSETGLFDEFVLTPVDDTSAVIFTLADISQELEWLFPGDNSLIVGASDGIVAVNGGEVGKPITADTVEATTTSADPCNSAYPVKKDGLIFYVGIDGRNMYYFEWDLLKEAFSADDANFVSYDITLGGITKLRFKKDRNDLIFAIMGGTTGNMLSCNFNIKEQIIGWHDNTTDGTFQDHAVITDNDGKPQLFALSLREGSFHIERQGEYVEFKNRVNFFTGKTQAEELADDIAYNRFVAEQLKECIYVDNATIFNNLQEQLGTFDSGAGTFTDTDGIFVAGDVDKHIVYKTVTGLESGRFLITAVNSANEVDVDVLQTPTASTSSTWYLSFNTVSGLADYNGTTVRVIADGGFLDDFAVSGGSISFNKQITHIVLGYKYKGIIKSFSLGFQAQGINSQRTMKALSEFGVRCVATAGLEVGASLYKLEKVQELSQDDINYLPPIPIDGTKYVSFSDDNEKDKFFFLVQDLPLPATVTTVIITGNYTLTT